MFINYEWNLNLWTCKEDILHVKTIRRAFIPYPGMYLTEITKDEPVGGWKIEKVSYSVKDNSFDVDLEDWRKDLTMEDLGDGWEQHRLCAPAQKKEGVNETVPDTEEKNQ